MRFLYRKCIDGLNFGAANSEKLMICINIGVMQIFRRYMCLKLMIILLVMVSLSITIFLKKKPTGAR